MWWLVKTIGITEVAFLAASTQGGRTKLESTVRYLGIEVDDALSISEQVEL